MDRSRAGGGAPPVTRPSRGRRAGAAAAALLVGLGPCGLSGCAELTPQGLTTAKARALLATYAEARNTANLALLDGIIDSAAVMIDPALSEPLLGLAVIKEFYRGSHGAFPDLHIDFTRVEVAAGWIVSEWTFTGTHLGPLGELPPTGATVAIDGVALSLVRGGKIVEDRVYYDLLGLYRQLGCDLLPPENGKL